jgi:DNA-binding transcriptional LysR family regulator
LPELKRVKQLEKDISIIESKKSRLTDLLIDGKIEQKDYDEKKLSFQRKLHQITEEKAYLEENIGQQKNISKRMSQLRQTLENENALDEFDRIVFESISDDLKSQRGVNYMMYNPQLDTFICVVEAGSFSKAAEELYISAPAVIKQINSLENSLNLQLFERTHRGLIITEAGKSLYQDAKYLIQYSKESLIRAQEAMNHNEEIIRVGISPMTPPEVFVELWPKIQKIYPEMKFKLITFENTPENAREILANMGKNIDVIAGIFDETMLELRGCDGTEISREPFCVAVSIHHRLAKKEKITLDDLAGENLMLMQRGWSYYGDMLRDDMMKNHPEINIVDFNLYNVEAFNRCENNNEVLLAFKSWESVHPLIRIIPVEWDYTMPFGILHSKKPSIKVKRLINAINKVK